VENEANLSSLPRCFLSGDGNLPFYLGTRNSTRLQFASSVCRGERGELIEFAPLFAKLQTHAAAKDKTPGRSAGQWPKLNQA